MKKCVKKCVIDDKVCKEKDCRMWINYKNDLNCSHVSIYKHKEMTLSEVAERLELSIVRVKQIQDVALRKFKKKSLLKGQ